MIGARLYELHKNADLTQNDFAAILNINKHSISSYKRDKSEPPDAIKIAITRYFNVSVDYLLGLTDSSAPLGRDKTVLRLPKAFPRELLIDVQVYARYLLYRHHKND